MAVRPLGLYLLSPPLLFTRVEDILYLQLGDVHLQQGYGETQSRDGHLPTGDKVFGKAETTFRKGAYSCLGGNCLQNFIFPETRTFFEILAFCFVNNT